MNIKNLVLGIGIFVIYMMMLVYGIQVIKPSPQFEDFCSPGIYEYSQPYKMTDVDTVCKFNKTLEDQSQTCIASKGMPIYDYSDSGCRREIKECNMCQTQFNNAQMDYQKTVFIMAVIIGIITLIIGFTILAVEPVGSSLMAAGIGAIFYGSTQNWVNLSNIWRFLLLVVALVLLVLIALKNNGSELFSSSSTARKK